MKKLLPVILGLVGLLGGAAAGHVLKPASEGGADGADMAQGDHGGETKMAMKPDGAAAHDPGAVYDYVKINNQFVVPIIDADKVKSLIVVSLSIEAEPGSSEEIYAREPKLRDEFLQVLFRHAQSGAFSGVFTTGQTMRDLRGSLREAARMILGPVAHDVLVTDIIRQDL